MRSIQENVSIRLSWRESVCSSKLSILKDLVATKNMATKLARVCMPVELEHMRSSNDEEAFYSRRMAIFIRLPKGRLRSIVGSYQRVSATNVIILANWRSLGRHK